MWNINDNIAYILLGKLIIFKTTKKCHFDLTAYTNNLPNVYYMCLENYLHFDGNDTTWNKCIAEYQSNKN